MSVTLHHYPETRPGMGHVSGSGVYVPEPKIVQEGAYDDDLGHASGRLWKILDANSTPFWWALFNSEADARIAWTLYHDNLKAAYDVARDEAAEDAAGADI